MLAPAQSREIDGPLNSAIEPLYTRVSQPHEERDMSTSTAIVPGQVRVDDRLLPAGIDLDRIRYYDLRRYWTKRVVPHLGDRKLNAILYRDFRKFTRGRFRPGDLPIMFEQLDFLVGVPGPLPRFRDYVAHGSCHWIVNFAIRLACLAEPDRPWRILTSGLHSSVWDGKRTLFEFNYLVYGIPARECFERAYDWELPPGRLRRVGYPLGYAEERHRSPSSSLHAA